jgi:hypothetical protein
MIDSKFIQVELSPNANLRGMQLRVVFHRCQRRFCGIDRDCPSFNRADPLSSFTAMQSWAIQQNDNVRQCNSGFPRRYHEGVTYFDATSENFVYHNTSHLARWIVPHVPLWLMAIGSHQCIKYLPDESLIPSIIDQLACTNEHAAMIIRVLTNKINLYIVCPAYNQELHYKLHS